MIPRFALITIGTRPLTMLQLGGLSDDEEDLISNYAFPFGSDWKDLIDGRSLKLFHIRRHEVCASLTVISSTETNRNADLYCLAVVDDAEHIDQLIRSKTNWPQIFFSPIIEILDNQKIRGVLMQGLSHKRNTHQTYRIGLFTLLAWMKALPASIFTWLRAQLQFRISFEYEFKNPSEWTRHEEHIRRIFLSTFWRRWILRKLHFSPSLPTFSTLVTSNAEITQIVCRAVSSTSKSIAQMPKAANAYYS